MLQVLFAVVISLTGIMLALLVNRFHIDVFGLVWKVLYFVLCTIVGLTIGLIWGLFEGFFKPRPYAYARRQAVARVFKTGFSLLCSLPGIRGLVAIERKSRRVTSDWWHVSTLNPSSEMSSWRPFRTLGRLYSRVYRSAKHNPYSTIRGLSMGAWIASRLPRF